MYLQKNYWIFMNNSYAKSAQKKTVTVSLFGTIHRPFYH